VKRVRVGFRLPFVWLPSGLLAVLMVVSAASAQTFTPIFTKQYTRAAGTPVTASDTFTVCDPNGMFRLVVINGPTGQDQIGTDPVSSGSLTVNGTEVVHESDFNQRVTQIVRPLTGIAQTNRLDVSIRSGPSGAIRATVEAVQSCGIRITSPATGTTLRAPVAFVRGTVPVAASGTIGVTVNDVAGVVEGAGFAAYVPIDPTVTSLTATARNSRGVLSSDTISVTVVAPSSESAVHLMPTVNGGVAPLTVRFNLSSIVPIVQVSLDADGDGVTDFQGLTLQDQPFTFTAPGLYIPTVRVTDDQGQVHTASSVVQVVDAAALDAQLQAIWTGFKDAVRAGNVTRAAGFLHSDVRPLYQGVLSRLSAATLANIDQIMTTIRFVDVGFTGAEYEMLRVRDGRTLSFVVRFQIDEDGLWRLHRF
jgi:hypothetical protein